MTCSSTIFFHSSCLNTVLLLSSAKLCSKLQFFVSVSSRYFFPSHTEDLCSTKKCPFYSECTLDENMEVQCACIQRCSLVFDPVCASDGETYPNECVFKITACALNGNITLLHQGQCSEFLPLPPFISRSVYFCCTD